MKTDVWELPASIEEVVTTTLLVAMEETFKHGAYQAQQIARLQ